MTAAFVHNISPIPPQMSRPLTASMILHGIVMLIAIVGLPYLKPDLPVIDEAVNVEFVPVDEKTQTDKAPARAVKDEKARPPEKEMPKPAPPQMMALTPPKPTAPKPPEKIDDVVKPDDVADPDSHPVKPLPKTPPKPLRHPVLTQDNNQEAFQSLLRNLMPTQAQPSDQTVNTAIEGDKPSPVATLASRMTMSELDGLKQQLSQCWSIVAGARYAEDLAVDVRLFMNSDRTVRQAKIMDEMRYNRDPFFRAAADSAMRAIRNPQCSPLRLPPEKYQQWKTIEVRFDPRDML